MKNQIKKENSLHLTVDLNNKTGYVVEETEGYLITYTTIDGNVDDGYFDTFQEAVDTLKIILRR